MNEQERSEVISTKEWMITLLITLIPIVNLIMFFVWGFGGNANPSKANWAKASLLWIAISIVLSVIFTLAFGGMAAMSM